MIGRIDTPMGIVDIGLAYTSGAGHIVFPYKVEDGKVYFTELLIDENGEVYRTYESDRTLDIFSIYEPYHGPKAGLKIGKIE